MAVCNFRYMTNNLVPGASYRTFSSENATYPFTNVIHNNRGKYWSPGGSFLIDSTNNIIYFNDGANQSATITAARYTTGAALATEIQTQMNAVSSSWVVSYNTSQNKFNFARTGTAVLRMSQQTNAIWDTIGFVGTTDKTIGFNLLSDELRNHTDEFVRIDLGVQTEVKFIGFIGPANEVFSLSQSATITIEGNNVDVWTAPPFSEALLRLKVQPVTVGWLAWLYIPPPRQSVLSVKRQLVTVGALCLLYIPPALLAAVLCLKVQLATITLLW